VPGQQICTLSKGLLVDQVIVEAAETRTVFAVQIPPEHFFGAEKRKLRRRLGRAHLGRDLS